MPPTPFPAGKTPIELGLDLTRQFVVCKEGGVYTDLVVKFSSGEHSKIPYWEDSTGDHIKLPLDWLAYYEPTEPEKTNQNVHDNEHCGTCNGSDVFKNAMTTQYTTKPTEPEAWEPKVGDKVAIKGDIIQITQAGSIYISTGDRMIYSVPPQALKLISRPAPRKVTMKEVCERFGETVIIEG